MRLKSYVIAWSSVCVICVIALWPAIPGVHAGRDFRGGRGVRASRVTLNTSKRLRLPRGTGDNYYDRTSCPDSYEQYYVGGNVAGSGSGGQSSAYEDRSFAAPSTSAYSHLATSTQKSAYKMSRSRNKPEIKIGFLGEYSTLMRQKNKD